MSYVLRPQLWRRQPRVPVEVDPNHPYAPYIDAALLPGVNHGAFIYNAVQKSGVTAPRNSGTGVLNGLAGGVHGLGYDIGAVSPQSDASTHDIVGAIDVPPRNCILVFNFIQGNVATRFGDGVGDFFACFDPDGIAGIVPVARVSSGNRAWGVNFSTGAHVFGWVIQDGNYKIYQEGKVTGTGATAHGNGGKLLRVGGLQGDGNAAHNVATIINGHTKEFSADFHAAVAENPWHIYKPILRRVYVGSAIVGSGKLLSGQRNRLVVA